MIEISNSCKPFLFVIKTMTSPFLKTGICATWLLENKNKQEKLSINHRQISKLALNLLWKCNIALCVCLAK